MKLSRIAAIVLIGIVTIFAAACGSGSGTPTTGFVTYTDYNYGFAISIPASWETEADQGVVFFLSPMPCVGLYPFSDVVAASAAGHASAQSYYSATFEPFIESLGDYQLISRENLTIDGTPAIKVVYTYTDGGYTFQETASILISQQTLWVIVGSCEITCWNQYAGTFDTMANSFHVLY